MRLVTLSWLVAHLKGQALCSTSLDGMVLFMTPMTSVKNHSITNAGMLVTMDIPRLQVFFHVPKIYELKLDIESNQ